MMIKPVAIHENTLKNFKSEGINCKNTIPFITSVGKASAKSRKNIPKKVRKNNDIITLIRFSVLYFMSKWFIFKLLELRCLTSAILKMTDTGSSPKSSYAVIIVDQYMGG